MTFCHYLVINVNDLDKFPMLHGLRFFSLYYCIVIVLETAIHAALATLLCHNFE